jgi:hypothetical protein
VNYKEFVPEGKTVKSEFCVQVVERLLKRISTTISNFETKTICSFGMKMPCLFCHDREERTGEWWRVENKPPIVFT